MTANAETILVYSGLELMGDGFMKIPFLRALRAGWPRARITWLAGKGKSVYAGALKPLVMFYLDEVIEDAGIGSRAIELFGRPLSGRRFDLVIDTQRRGLTTLILRRVRHRVFVSGMGDFWFSDLKPLGRYEKPPALVNQLLDLARVAVGSDPGFGPSPSLPEQYGAAARAALPDGERYVGLVPGAGGKHKCWPRERYVALAKRLIELGIRPVFLLGPQEPGWHGELHTAVPEAFFPLQDTRVAPELVQSPLYTMAVGRRLKIAITNDCGTAHMLAAADTPLISLFGPSSPFKFAPFTPDLTIIRAQDFGGESMAAIPFGAVAAVVERKLNSMRANVA